VPNPVFGLIRCSTFASCARGKRLLSNPSGSQAAIAWRLADNRSYVIVLRPLPSISFNERNGE
jgi:hypothetical protein